MAELASVFDIIQTSENKVNIFCEKLTDVYAHAKSEIIDFLQKLKNEILIELRNTLFNKLLEFLPQYSVNKLYARRSKLLMSEDVYIIGYSVINTLEDKRLKKILKGEQQVEAINDSVFSVTQEDPSDGEEKVNLLVMCTELKVTVETLTTEIYRLRTRVCELEEQFSDIVIKQRTVQPTDNHTDPVDKECSSTEAASDTVVTPETTGDVPEEISAQTTTQVSHGKEKIQAESGFRHTNTYRNKIVNGGKRKANNSQQLNRDQVIGSSKTLHRIESAVTNGSSKESISDKNHLVYVGRISKSTTEDAMRAHVADLGIPDEKVADVIKLKSKNLYEASFCISVSCVEAEEKLFDPRNWPEGARIRHFYEKTYNEKTFNKRSQGSRSQLPPRLRRKPNLYHRHKREMSYDHRSDNLPEIYSDNGPIFHQYHQDYQDWKRPSYQRNYQCYDNEYINYWPHLDYDETGHYRSSY